MIEVNFFFIAGPTHPDLSEIPSIFLDAKFDLHDPAYFNAIFMSDEFRLRIDEGTSTVRKPPSLLDSPKSSEENRPEKLQMPKFKFLADKVNFFCFFFVLMVI